MPMTPQPLVRLHRRHRDPGERGGRRQPRRYPLGGAAQGRGDFGVNAARVRGFLAALRDAARK